MRFVLISDTHEQHDRTKVPDGDVLIHAGDFTWCGSIPAVARFANWLEALPHKTKIVIAGNHDILFEDNNLLAREMLEDVCTYLQDSGVIIPAPDIRPAGHLKIWGSPWSPKFSTGWVFNLMDAKQSKRVWDLIPTDTDILITHCPPHGTLDSMLRYEHHYDAQPSQIEFTGCPYLLQELDRVRPRLHVFGHIHPQHGRVDSAQLKTIFVNASIYNDDSDILNQPIVIDIGN